MMTYWPRAVDTIEQCRTVAPQRERHQRAPLARGDPLGAVDGPVVAD